MVDQGRVGYAAAIPILGALAVSLALMIGGERLLIAHHYPRGPAVIARAAMTAVATPIVALPWLGLTWFLLRRSARGQRAGACLLVAGLSVPGALFVVDAANVRLDQAPPTTHVVRFVAYVAPRRGSGYDVVSSWRDPGNVAFTSTLPGRHRPGELLELTVHRGGLGLEYVTSVRAVARAGDR